MSDEKIRKAAQRLIDAMQGGPQAEEIAATNALIAALKQSPSPLVLETAYKAVQDAHLEKYIAEQSPEAEGEGEVPKLGVYIYPLKNVVGLLGIAALVINRFAPKTVEGGLAKRKP